MIAGITRVRNCEGYIVDTLKHFAQFCDQIYLYDDCSTDNTPTLAYEFGAIVIRGKEWGKDRQVEEYKTRQTILNVARQDDPDWILYFDADERIDWDWKGYEEYDAVRMKLYDFYITSADKSKTYKDRQFIGPEYRRITMLYRNNPEYGYFYADQREASTPNARVLDAGSVKHYGKAISVEDFERKCEYYATHFPEPYRSKWANRKGKAIHTHSDFGRELCTWKDRDLFSLPMEG